MSMHIILALFAFFFVCTSAQTIGSQVFEANVRVREAGMVNAYQSGVLKYDFARQRMRLDFNGVEFFELYTWSGNSGQFVYKSGNACKSTCETTTLNYTMPAFFVNPTYYTQSGTVTIDGVTLTRFLPKTASLVSALYASGSTVSLITFTNGRNFSFVTSTPSSSFADSLFVSPPGCSCGNRLDIAIVVDRSGSIALNGEWNFVVKFVNDTINKLTFGTTGVYLSISSFNVGTWTTLTMAEGVTRENALRSIPRLDYCKSQRSDLFPGTTYYQQCNNRLGATESNPCCEGYTCLECAVEVGAAQLKASPRFNDNIDRVLIVITDGTANVRPTSSFNTKGPDCSGPSGYGGLSRTSSWSQVTQAAIDGATGQCWNQIYKELLTQKAAIPRLNLFSIGIGTNEISNLELEVLAGGDPTHRFTASNFSALGSILDRVLASICIPQEKPCGDCCGFCVCGTCTKPTSCDPAPPCTVPVQSGTCCLNNQVGPEIICPPQNCKVAVCLPNVTTNNGCVYTNETRCVTFNNVCERYECAPSNGLCTKVWDNPQCFNECVLPSDCGSDPCKIYTCEQITLVDNVTNTQRNFSRCSSTVKVCDNSNLCAPQFCNSTGQCETTVVTCVRNPAACWNGTCIPETGICNWTELQGPTCNTQCVIASDCNDNNSCTDEVCLTVGNGTRCSSNPVTNCTDLDPCHKRQCLPDEGCVWQNVTCLPDDPAGCFFWTCDISDGICKKTVNQACVDKCVDDASCFLDSCQTSKCVQPNTTKVCNYSTVECGTRTCASAQCLPASGCAYTNYSASYCDDYNPCTTDACVEGEGCTHTNITCPGANDNPCTVVQCDPFLGCISFAKECGKEMVCQEEKQFYKKFNKKWSDVSGLSASEKNQYQPEPTCDRSRNAAKQCNCTLVPLYDCSIAFCNQTSGQCVDAQQPCESVKTFDVVTGAVLGAGAIVGIVIAAVLCAAFAGGGSYAAYESLNNENTSAIKNNPLYEDNAKGGANPLHNAAN